MPLNASAASGNLVNTALPTRPCPLAGQPLGREDGLQLIDEA